MGTVARWFHGREQIQLLLHWRWLVLMIAIPISILIELVEGESEGLHLLDEVLIDGIIQPAVTWIALTFAAQKLAGQFKREADLERRRDFTRRLDEHREFYDLAKFLVRFPATLLPVERASLFINDDGQLTHLADWSVKGAIIAGPRGPEKRCVACGSRRAAGSADDRCAACSYAAADELTKDYCLILIHENIQIGMLELRWKDNEQPAAESLELLTSLAAEIAMALARAIENSRATAQVYREAQAYERRRLTQALHDSLAQQLFYLNLSLDQLAGDEAIVANEGVQHKLAAMRDVAADVYEQVRSNLSILRAWEQVNLSEALSDLARSTARNANLSVAIDLRGEPEWLSPHTCEHVYSAVREALNNIVKHAGAHHVQLLIDWSPEWLAVQVTDDGVGFDLRQAPEEGHYGLALMQESIEALGGQLSLSSSPDQGATLCLSIPLTVTGPALETGPGMSHRLQATLAPAG